MSTLIDLRNEVLAHGFDVGSVFTLDDITKYLNFAMRRVARKVDYFTEETAQSFTTVAGTSSYSWPADLGRLRYLLLPDDQTVLGVLRMRDLDGSATATGKPSCYALSGSGVVLYPTPDAAYELTWRYYALPSLMTADADVPSIPQDYHEALVFYALQRCYEREDDAEMAAYWSQRWELALRDMRSDVKFPSADGPHQIDSMWPAATSAPRYVIP
jgi:hypothetical protein